MKRKINNKELLMLTINKLLFSGTEVIHNDEEFEAYLRKDNARPQAEKAAEARRAIEEAKREFEQITYLY